MKALLDWIDNRTGLRTLLATCSDRKIPGGADWWHVWPAAITFAFAVQVITGLFLWMFYSPGGGTAWESVYFLQSEVFGGWLVRGIHHFSAQVLVALVGLNVLQMILRRTYRPPREFVFWTSVFLGLIALAAVLTGDLLAWDENSYWATSTRVGYLTLVPIVGDQLHKLAMGGPGFGHLTLTRFFALHAGAFAPLFLVCLVLYRRAGRRADELELAEARRAGWAWPNQAVRNAAGCAVLMVVVLALSVQHAFLGERAAGPPGEYLGAELGAPADPAEFYDAARPEWSFLGLYGLANRFQKLANRLHLHELPGLGVSSEFIPIFLLPGLVVLLVLCMPLVGRFSAGHVLNVVVTFVVLVGLIALSVEVVLTDRGDPDHQAALAAGRAQARRAVALAQSPQGIPAGGALTLLRSDPKTQGPRLFKQHCASCHDYTGGGEGADIKAEESSAPNLYQFAGRDWLTGFLDHDQIAGAKYFGNTAFKDGTMVGFVTGSLKELKDDIGEEDFQKLVAALAAQSAYDAPPEADQIDEEAKFLFEDFTCVDCHKFHDLGSLGVAPDLTGYGSREWLIGIISDPTQKRFYRDDNDRMPAYAEDAQAPENNVLTARHVEMLADWLRGKWYEPPSQ